MSREVLVRLSHPARGEIMTTGLGVKLSDTGEHTEELLLAYGYTPE
ncbi:MAG: hypothetical protein ACREQN_04010 [Candidatus Binataceae bacterium]